MPKSKSKSKASARVVRGRVPPAAWQDNVVRFYTGHLDAFRLPDEETTPSGLMRMPNDYAVSSNAQGDAAIGFLPSLNLDVCTSVITTGSLAATWAPTIHPLQTTLSNASYRSRMTGWRIVVSYVGAELNAAGTMYVGTGNAWNTNAVSAPMTNYTGQMRPFTLKAGEDITIYAPMIGRPQYDVLSNSWQNQYWSGVVLFFRGMPASVQCIQIRTIRSIEYAPEISSTPLVDLEAEVPDSAMMTEAGVLSGSAQAEGDADGPGWAASVGKAVYGVAKGATKAIVDQAKRDLKDHLQMRSVPTLEF